MKEAVTVSIKSPCAENWESFTPTKQGGFCQQCNKNVADLTKMTERELLEFLRSRASTSCARMRKDQLGRHDLPVPARTGLGLFKAAAATLILVLIGKQGHGQATAVARIDGIEASVQKTDTQPVRHDKLVSVSGKVVDESGSPMPGVNILLQGTHMGTVSDAEGRFSFPEPVEEGQTLLFMFIGYVTQEFKVKGSVPDAVEINMAMDEWDIMGELLVDQPYTVQPNKSLWSKIKRLF